jgi:hypothetical protein
MNDTIKPQPQEYYFKISPHIGGASDKRTFSGTAYGGGVITDHGWWDRVVFDLKTAKAADRMPVLLDHDSREIVGFTEKVRIGKNIQIDGIISSQETGRKVAAMADEGFPWQLSVRIYPDTVSFYDTHDSVEVNGVRHEGPVHVLRDSVIREVSFCALGADRDTVVNVFNLNKERHMSNDVATKPAPESTVNRDLALQALTDEKNQFKAQAEEAKGKFAAMLTENADLKSKIQSAEFENRTLKESLEVARRESTEFRQKYDELAKTSRLAVLEEDYKRCGLEFKADDESVKAMLAADGAAFEAFRNVLKNVKTPMAPPAGAFDSVTQPTQFEAAKPARDLVAMAAELAKKEVK